MHSYPRNVPEVFNCRCVVLPVDREGEDERQALYQRGWNDHNVGREPLNYSLAYTLGYAEAVIARAKGRK